jgi:hypothetical protein
LNALFVFSSGAISCSASTTITATRISAIAS